MKNEPANNSVQEKMDALDTLSGGIVFGKEQAWEKLQARMEAKPARKTLLRYWKAAAAILLLFVCATAIYKYPSQKITKANKALTTPNGNSAVTPQPLIPQEAVTTQVDTGSGAIEKTRGPVVQAPIRKKAIPVIARIQKQLSPVVQSTQETAITPAPQVMPIAQPKLDTLSVATNTPPGIDFSKMRVVHINDVEKEEREVKKIRKENRMTLSHYPFLRHSDDYPNPADARDNEEYPEPHKLLKSIFNPQN